MYGAALIPTMELQDALEKVFGSSGVHVADDTPTRDTLFAQQ